MKNLILVLATLTLTACGGSGGGSAPSAKSPALLPVTAQQTIDVVSGNNFSCYVRQPSVLTTGYDSVVFCWGGSLGLVSASSAVPMFTHHSGAFPTNLYVSVLNDNLCVTGQFSQGPQSAGYVSQATLCVGSSAHAGVLDYLTTASPFVGAEFSVLPSAAVVFGADEAFTPMNNSLQLGSASSTGTYQLVCDVVGSDLSCSDGTQIPGGAL